MEDHTTVVGYHLDQVKNWMFRKGKVYTVVDELFDMLRSIPESSFEKSSKLYEAVNYMTKQEEYFRVILKDGNIPVHNSSCEQALSRALSDATAGKP